MIKHNQDGAANGLVISLVLAILLLIGVIVFGAWAYSSRQDYKNNTDAKIAAAVTVAKQQESSLKDKQFQEESKNPLTTYHGPEAYGSLNVAYPKTWSGYVNDNGGNNGALVDAYFYPGVVPSTTKQGGLFALRIQVLNQPYSQILSGIANEQKSEDPPQVSPYALPKVPKAVGVKVSDSSGTTIILPLRSQTLEIWTDGNQFQSDFNNIILPNLSFSP
jgi:hypothetical protein